MHISLMRDLSVYCIIHCQLDIADLSPSVLENKTTNIIMGHWNSFQALNPQFNRVQDFGGLSGAFSKQSFWSHGLWRVSAVPNAHSGSETVDCCCWFAGWGLLQTVNDVFLAMLDASLHRYLQNHYHKELHPPDLMGMQTLWTPSRISSIA
jgi:hypothetical protein